MSVEICLQGFRDGDSHDADVSELRDALAPYIIETANGWDLRTGNSRAEIYGLDDLASGFMVTHVAGAELYDVLVRVAALCDLVILMPGLPAALTRDEQQRHLPEEIRVDAKLVTSGADLVALIESA